MSHEPELRDEPEQEFSEGAQRSFVQRTSETLRQVAAMDNLGNALLKIGIILILAWLLAGAIQQLVIIALVIGALLLLFDVIRHNILS